MATQTVNQYTSKASEQTAQRTDPYAPEFEANTVPHHDVFAWNQEHAAAILNQRAISRIAAAMKAIQTLASMLQQRGVDTAIAGPSRLVFGSAVAEGITTAIGCCAELVSTIMDETDSLDFVKAGDKSPEARRVLDLGMEIWQAKRLAQQAAA